jgi:type IV fimbrial biogenesis protein FimT
MIAELLGSALSAFVRALMVAIYNRSPQKCALAAPIHSRIHVGRRRGRGFSLTELTVATAIVGVVSTTGAPPLISMMATQRVKTATVDLYAALTYARSEAIKRNSVVTITPRNGNFADGYDVDASGVVLMSQLGSPSVTVAAPNGITLAFSGYGRLTTSASYQLELSSAQNSGVSKRCIVVSATGRPSIRMDNDHDGNCING